LYDNQEYDEGDKDFFHAGLVHRAFSAIGKSLTLSLA
jgi:hypothetical protein